MWFNAAEEITQMIIAWWRHQMETFSALLVLCEGNPLVTSGFYSQRPVTWSFDVFFDPRLNKGLSEQSWGWWFEMPLRSFWRDCNERPLDSPHKGPIASMSWSSIVLCFRDLPISVVIAMLSCTCIYLLTNIAYLSAMTPGDILNADAVALSFMESSFGKYAAVFITVAVVLSCMGTVNGSFLSDSK